MNQEVILIIVKSWSMFTASFALVSRHRQLSFAANASASAATTIWHFRENYISNCLHVTEQHHDMQPSVLLFTAKLSVESCIDSTRDVMQPAEIRFHWIRISHLTYLPIRMRIYHTNYLQTVLPNKSLK